MKGAQVLRALGPIDAAYVRRDSLLRWMFLMPVLFALLFRWLAAIGGDWLAGHGIDLTDFYPLVASGLVVMPPTIYGIVVGFLLLDQKDDRTLMALRVTPLTASGYLAYRITIPMALSILATPVVLALGGFSGVGLGKQLLAAIVAAPFAPVFALFLAAFARNKVQGFALMKAAGVVNWPPMIAWFMTSNWQLAFGISPTYWPFKFYWELEARSPGAWIYAVVGFLYLSAIIVLLQRRFEGVVAR